MRPNRTLHFQHPSYGKLEPIYRGLAVCASAFHTPPREPCPVIPTVFREVFEFLSTPFYGELTPWNRGLVVEVAFNTHSRETMPEVRWGMGGGNTTFNTHSRKSSSCCRIVCYAYHALSTPLSWETITAGRRLSASSTLPTPISWETMVYRCSCLLGVFQPSNTLFAGTVPNSLIFYYSSAYCQATFSGQKFSSFYLGVYDGA
jgi:hypothetical protein